MTNTINCRELRRRLELDGSRQTVAHLTEAMSSGDLKPEDFSLRELAEGLIPEFRNGKQTEELLEGNEDFINVTGAVIERKILDAYHSEVFALSRLVSTIPTRFDGEKMNLGGLPDGATEVAPGAAYPTVNLGDNYIETPQTAKHGLIVPVTKEAVFFDRTHFILQRAAEVGETLALNKEKRILRAVLGLVPSYKFNGTVYSTYQSAVTDTDDDWYGNEPWVNALPNNALENWANIDAVEELLARIIDPTTNEPLLNEPDTVLVMPPKRHIAHRLFNGAELSYNDAANSTVSAIKNPYTKYKVVSSRLAYRMLQMAGVPQAENVWFIGDFKKAFAYMENWGITVSRSGSGSESDFTQDVLVRYKASERGVPAVLNPRYAAKCTA